MSAPDRESIDTPRGSVPWIYAGTVSLSLAGGVFYLYLARVAPAAEIGAVAVLGAIATLVTVGISLGLGTGFQHFVSFYRGRGDSSILRALLRASLEMTAALSVAALAVTLVFAGELSALFFHDGRFTSLIQLLAIFSAFTATIGILQSVLVGLQRFVVLSAISLVQSMVMYGSAVVFLTLWPGVESIILGWTLGAGVSVVLCLREVLRDVPQTGGPFRTSRHMLSQHGFYRSLFLYSIPVFVSGLIGTGAFYTDRLVLAYLVDLSSVGIYNYAILVASASLLVVSPFGTVLVPRISALFARKESTAIRKVTRTSISLLVLVYVPVALGLAAISPFFLGALVGPGYAAASLPLAILLVLTAATIPYAVFGSLAAGTRRTSLLMKASGLALLTNVLVSVILVPRTGMTGAALGNSAMTWVPFFVLYLGLRKTGLIQFDPRSLAGIWGSALTMVASVAVPFAWLGYRPVLAPLFLMIGIVVFALMLRFVRAVTSDMAAALVHALPRRGEFLRPAIAWFVAVDPTEPTPKGGP